MPPTLTANLPLTSPQSAVIPTLPAMPAMASAFGGVGSAAWFCQAAAAHHASSAYSLNPYMAAASLIGTTSNAYPKLCLDPYCKTCPSPMAYHSARPCALGCIQCSHGDVPANPWFGALAPPSMFGAHHFGAAAPALPPQLNPFLAAHLAAAQSAGASPMSNNSASVCWWENGDGSGFCLKRFTNADEFFQHLRSHALDSAQKTNLAPTTLAPQANNNFNTLSTTNSPPTKTSQAAATAAYLGALNLSAASSARYHPYAGAGHHVKATDMSMPLGAYGSALLSAAVHQRLPGALPFQ